MESNSDDYLSGEVKEILASQPSWVATWGTSILIAAVAIIVLAALIFRYPEVVSGEVVLTTETPPVQISAQKSDFIKSVLVDDGGTVKRGDVIAIFPSDADYKDVLALEADVETVGQLDLDKLRSYKPKAEMKIGELAQAYSSFVTAFSIVPLDETGEIDNAAVAAVESTNLQYKKQLRALEAALPSIEKELRALDTELRNASNLYAKTTDTTMTAIIYGINSKIQNKKAEYARIQTSIESTKIDISKANVRRFQAQTQAESGAGDAIFQLNEKLDELRQAIKKWKSNYLIIAPSDGILKYYTPLVTPQQVNMGEVLFTIGSASNSEKFIGKVALPLGKSGKVKKGQPVTLKFDRYNFREFGTVNAKVTNVYSVAKDQAFYADILVENGLVSNLNKKLEFYQQMSGKAEITTNDQSFFRKLFEKFTAFW